MTTLAPRPRTERPPSWRLPCTAQEIAAVLHALHEGSIENDATIAALLDSPALSIELLSLTPAQPVLRDWAASSLAAAGESLLTAWLLLRSQRVEGEAFEALLKHSRTAARLSQNLARKSGLCSPDLAWLAGLWHNLGQLEFSRNHPGYPGPVCDAREIALLSGERKQYGADHARVAAMQVAALVPCSSLDEAIELHHAPVEFVAQLPGIVRVLRAAVELLATGDDSAPKIAKLLEIEPAIASTLLAESMADLPARAAEVTAPDPATAELVSRGLITSAFAETDIANCAKRLGTAASLLLNREGPVLLQHHEAGYVVLEDFSIPGEAVCLQDTGSALSRSLQSGKTVVANAGADAASADDWILARRLGAEALISVPWKHETSQGVGIWAVAAPPGEAEFMMLGALVRSAAKAITEKRGDRLQADQAVSAALNAQRISTRQLAHEISNPLSVIGNYLDIIGRGTSDGKEETNQQIALVQSEIQRAQRLIALLGRPAATAQPQRNGSVNEALLDLRALVADTLFGQRSIELAMNLAHAVPEVAVPPDALKQMLLNLLLNASEALEGHGGQVKVTTSSNTNLDGRPWLEVSVDDDGPGLPRTSDDRLELPAGSNKSGQHSGTGLAVVRELLAQHGGHLLCWSSPGSGTRFSLLLPVAQ